MILTFVKLIFVKTGISLIRTQHEKRVLSLRKRLHQENN